MPGLRREKLALLAAVSVEYYVRLVQGRSAHVSDSVLDAVARVLELTGNEREHLGNLARPGHEPRRPHQQSITAGIRRLLDSTHDVHAVVNGRRMEILAWNSAACAVFELNRTGSGGRNGARMVFLNPNARSWYLNWNAVAANVVAQLRLKAGRHPQDPLLASLVGELSIHSDDFRLLWAKNDVKQKTSGVTRVAHPTVGELDVAYETLAPPAQPDQFLTPYTSTAGSPTDERLRLMLSWTAADTTMKTVVGDDQRQS